MDIQTARAILSEVASGGWLDQEIPESDSEVIETAEYYVEEAVKWVEEGNPSEDHIDAIINLAKGAQVSPPVLSETAEHTNDGVPPGEIDSPVAQGMREYFEDKAPHSNPIEETYPRRSSGGFSESDLREQEEPSVFEGLPLPQQLPEGAPLEMPVDMTDEGDKSVRRLYSTFGSYVSRARWNLATAEGNLSNATHLRDEAYRSEFVKLHRRAEQDGMKLTQSVAENFAKDTEQYQEWNDRVQKHQREVAQWKALVGIYGGNVERLSREWTMRTEQYERER